MPDTVESANNVPVQAALAAREANHATTSVHQVAPVSRSRRDSAGMFNSDSFRSYSNEQTLQLG